MARAELSPWIQQPKYVEDPLLRLFCIPYAGGDASVFRLWPNYLPATIEVNSIEFPGCLRRVAEEPYTRMAPLIEDLARFLLPFLDRSFAFFGVCTGAFIAHQLAIRIRDLCGREPLHLFPTCMWAPHLPYGHRHIHQLPQEEFIKEFGQIGGMPPETMAQEELMKILLVAARADFEVSETYQFVEKAPLTCPLTAIGANLDDLVSPGQIEAWSKHTSGPFKSKILDSDHCLWETARESLVQTIGEEIKNSLESEREESFL